MIARMFVVAVLTLSSVGAMAQDRAAGLPAKGGKDTYGSAGCGLGSLLFGSEPGMVQVLAATTNGTLGNQTFGITTGTLNCGDPAIGGRGARLFIEANKEALAKDAARGSGETIATLSHLAGCKDPAAVGATLQRNFQAVFPSATATSDVVVENVLTTLKSEPALACRQLG
jgi:hypothetical protein